MQRLTLCLPPDWRRVWAARVGWLLVWSLLVAHAPVMAQQGPTRPSPSARGSAPARGASPLEEARRLYNLGRFEAAIAAAEQAIADLASRPQGLLVLGRARLERFRQTSDPTELEQAREALDRIDVSKLEGRDRVELVVGLGQALFLDNEFRAAAEVFVSALDRASTLGSSARDQLLDWWATSLDRHAQARPVTERPAIYDRIVAQMEQELQRDAGAVSASYWLAAGLRLRGDIDRAWAAVLAAWVRAPLTPDRGAALRQDLEQLMRDAIIPERARRATPAGQEPDAALATLAAEWDAFKAKWPSRR